MKQFEKDLKVILDKYYSCSPAALTDQDIPVPSPRIRLLTAMKLIEAKAFYDNRLRIVPTDDGITYFSRESEKRRELVLQWTVNFAVAVLSACFGSVFTLVLQWLITK